ncbi:MAG: hypothetical protein K0S15_2259 [Solirubrobacterales bacterium]|jgi:hypothetical protein|nr:hypothetical protein [Solirubrobacterales bacterium]
MGNGATVTSWTCERCEVTTSWMPGVEVPRLPPNWSEHSGVLYCLGCQRELAGEDGVASLPEDAPADDRRKQHSHSRIAFEIGRDPERPDQQIAKVCRTSVVAVRRARERIGSPKVTAKSQGA